MHGVLGRSKPCNMAAKRFENVSVPLMRGGASLEVDGRFAPEVARVGAERALVISSCRDESSCHRGANQVEASIQPASALSISRRCWSDEAGSRVHRTPPPGSRSCTKSGLSERTLNGAGRPYVLPDNHDRVRKG